VLRGGDTGWSLADNRSTASPTNGKRGSLGQAVHRSMQADTFHDLNGGVYWLAYVLSTAVPSHAPQSGILGSTRIETVQC